MDQDRLAEARAQRQAHTSASEPIIIEVQRVPESHPTNGAVNGPPAQRQADTLEHPIIEVQRVPAPQPASCVVNEPQLPVFQVTSSISAFYVETASIQESITLFDANVTAIADLHTRLWSALSKHDSVANRSRLADLTESTCALTKALSERIKALKVKPEDASARAQIRRNRITLVYGKFVETLQRYQIVEQQYRQRYRDRIEWQYRNVKPDAPQEEVSAVVNDAKGSGSTIFLNAATSSTQDGESRGAYGEVQQRYQDIQRIELTLEELALLFNNMALFIAEQDEQITTIEAKAIGVKEDMTMTKGVGEADSNAQAKRSSWICGLIVIIQFLAMVGLSIGFGVQFSHEMNASAPHL